MTMRRRFVRRAGRAVGRAALRAAFTYIGLKPIINHNVTVAGVNGQIVTDLTALLETDIGAQAFSPTYLRASGMLTVLNQNLEGLKSGLVSTGFFMGAEGMDAGDFPDLSTTPSRFMWVETRAIDLYPRVAAPSTPGDSGMPFYREKGIFRPRFNFSKRSKPGEHLFLVTQGSIVNWQLKGEVQILVKLR